MKFQNKKVVVTGGAKGIGKAIAEAFLAEGATVLIVDRDQKAGEAFALENERGSFFLGDLAQKSVLDDLLTHLSVTDGSVSVLVNNAMLSQKGLLSDCSYEDFEYVQRVGVTAPYYLSNQLFQRKWFDKGASIINLASTRAFQSQADTESYSAAKGGILALTHALAVSLAGVARVNAISPGWIDTSENPGHSLADQLQHPVGRVGKPSDIAQMALFLASDAASFITGENVTIDGGMSKLMIYHDDQGWSYGKN